MSPQAQRTRNCWFFVTFVPRQSDRSDLAPKSKYTNTKPLDQVAFLCLLDLTGMTNPIDPILNAALHELAQVQIEEWEERASILEFEAGYARPLAEALALVVILSTALLTNKSRSPE